MHTPPIVPPTAYAHEHARPAGDRFKRLKTAVDENNLTEMWDMILQLDYQVKSSQELHYETREEFYDIIELLLKAFVK